MFAVRAASQPAGRGGGAGERAGGRRSAPSARLCSAAPPRPPEARRPGAGGRGATPPAPRKAGACPREAAGSPRGMAGREPEVAPAGFVRCCPAPATPPQRVPRGLVASSPQRPGGAARPGEAQRPPAVTPEWRDTEGDAGSRPRKRAAYRGGKSGSGI